MLWKPFHLRPLFLCIQFHARQNLSVVVDAPTKLMQKKPVVIPAKKLNAQIAARMANAPAKTAIKTARTAVQKTAIRIAKNALRGKVAKKHVLKAAPILVATKQNPDADN